MANGRVTIGRIVHYYDGIRVRPAIVTTVHSSECVNLMVFCEGSYPPLVTRTSVIHDAADDREPAAHTWHWPPRER